MTQRNPEGSLPRFPMPQFQHKTDGTAALEGCIQSGYQGIALARLRHNCASIRRIIGYKVTAAGARLGEAGSISASWRIRNVEPSAQFGAGYASDRRFSASARTGSGAESRGRQEPLTDLRGNLHSLP